MVYWELAGSGQEDPHLYPPVPRLICVHKIGNKWTAALSEPRTSNVRDWSLITGRGAHQNGKIMGP